MLADLHLTQDSTHFDTRKFDAVLADIYAFGGPQAIPRLMAEFRDDAHHHAMFAMIHLIKIFETEI